MKIAQTGALISLWAAIGMLPPHLNAAATAVPAPAPPPANPSQINPPKTPQPNQGTQPLLPLDIQRLRNNEVPARGTRGTNGVLPFQPGSTNIPMEPGTNRVPGQTNAAGLTNWPSFPTNFPPVRTNVPPFGPNGVPGLTNWPLWPTNWPLMGTNFPLVPTNGRSSTNLPFGSTNAGAGPTATNRYVQTNTIKFLTNKFIGTNPTAFPR